MYHTIYKTINILNKKIYVGYHKAENLEDDYLGSGKHLLRSIEKYGRGNFKKEILFIFPTKAEALLKEAEMVDEEFIKRKDTYNFKLGGEGGWDHIPRMLEEDKEFRKKMYKKVSNGLRIAHKEGRLGWEYYKGPNGMTGKKHSKETKKKLSENNGNKLDLFVKLQRVIDYNNIEKNKGWVTNLAKKWGVSHTQVRRFINSVPELKVN